MNKIKKIIVHNFKGIDHVVYTCEGPFELFAENGYGKTSFLEALRFGLTGKMPKDMLRHGTDEGYVCIEFNDADNTIVERRFFEGDKPNKVKMNGKVCTAKAAQKIICDIMGASEDKLDVFTSHELFCELINGDLGKFLLAFIGEPFSIKKLYDIVEFSDEEKEKIKADKLLPDKFEITAVSDVYNTLFAERKNLKALITSLNAKYEFPAEGEEDTIEKPKFESEKELKKAEEEYLIYKTAKKTEDEKLRTYKSALNEYNIRLARKQSLKKQLDETPVVDKVDEEEITSLETQLSDIRKAITAATSAIASNEVIVRNNQKIYDALDSNSCPISACLVCKTDKSSVKKEVEESISLAAKVVEDSKESLKALTNSEETIKEKINTLKKQLKAYSERETIEKRWADIDVGSEPIKPEMPVISEDAAMFPMYQDEYNKYWEYISAKEYKEKSISKLNLCVSLLNKFAPKGIVNEKIMQHYCDLFDEDAEAVAELFGYEIKFIPEDGVKLKIRPNPSKQIVDFASLSRGEQLITSIIIYAVLNSLMGTGIIVLDNFNDLDNESAKKAKGIINALYDDLGFNTIFVVGCEIIE